MCESSTLQRDTQEGGLGALSSDPQGAARAERQPFGRRRHRAHAGGHSWWWGVVAEETPFGAASCRGAVPVMDRQRRGRHIWRGIKSIIAHVLPANTNHKPEHTSENELSPLRALPRPDLNSLMRGWMMGDRATRGRWVWPPLVEPEAEPGPEPVSRLEEKFTWGEREMRRELMRGGRQKVGQREQ